MLDVLTRLEATYAFAKQDTLEMELAAEVTTFIKINLKMLA